MKGKIPISDAKRISEARKLPIVIVFGLHADGHRISLSTWGKTKKLCKVAAGLADSIIQAVEMGRVVPPQTEPPDSVLTPAQLAMYADGDIEGADYP